MKNLHTNEHYKVERIELSAGDSIPRHSADSEAFLIVESGNALLIYKGETCELHVGTNMTIPSREQHILRAIDDFKAFIILGTSAHITYAGIA